MRATLPASFATVLFLSPLLPPEARAAAPRAAEMSEEQAVGSLVAFVGSHAAYGIPAGCLRPKTIEYRNAGYMVDLFGDACPGAAPGALLGRWRVDARTGEAFVRNEKGKFVALVSSKGTAAEGTAPAKKGSGSVTVREERTVVVNGVAERWRLEWVGPTKQVCTPDKGWVDEWGLCPCSGFEFAEDGDLELVRIRPGVPEERLDLTPFFGDGDAPGSGAVLRRWPVEKGDDDASEQPGFAARVRARAPAPAMVLGDYDHDGRATEFVVQIGAIPCGHHQAIVVGVDARNPRLHAFTSVEEPRSPLVLESRQAWEQFRKSSGYMTIRLWGCGDHGSDEERSVHLRAKKDGIHAKGAVKPCP